MHEEVIDDFKKSINIKEKNINEFREGTHILIKKIALLKVKELPLLDESSPL